MISAFVIGFLVMVGSQVARIAWPELEKNMYTKEDGYIEEFVEEIIEEKSGVDLDLSPFSVENPK